MVEVQTMRVMGARWKMAIAQLACDVCVNECVKKQIHQVSREIGDLLQCDPITVYAHHVMNDLLCKSCQLQQHVVID